jgi:6-phosphogluconolactonase
VVDAGVEAGFDAGMNAGIGGTPLLYVGSAGGHIYAFELNLDADTLSPRGSWSAGINPSFLAFHPTKPVLYAVQETTPGTVSAYEIDPASGALTFMNKVLSGGDWPTHIHVDSTGKVAMTANYLSGTVAVLPLDGATGALGAPSDTRAPGEKAHQIVTDPSSRWVLTPCLGSDRVAQFELDTATGTLTPNAVPAVASPSGAGPRHLDFHPSRKFAYLINELNNTMSACAFNEKNGQLTLLETKSTLPSGFTGSSKTAEVWVHPNGRFVYGSNRGHDSIVIFAIDQTTGLLTQVGHEPTGGRSPRSFAVDPTGTMLIVANKGSDSLRMFRIDPVTGRLIPVGGTTSVPSPAFVGVRALPKR